jgi:hypothetical protein
MVESGCFTKVFRSYKQARFACVTERKGIEVTPAGQKVPQKSRKRALPSILTRAIAR